MAMTNFGSVDFNGEEVRALADIIKQKTFEALPLNTIHTVLDNIVAEKQVVYAGLLSKITKLDAGCGTGNTSKAITFTQKKWSPKQVKVWLQMCGSEFETNLGVYLKTNKMDMDDLTAGGLADFIASFITPAMVEDIYRIAWFNDTTHTVAGAGSGTELLTSGTSLTDYTIIDGLWTQIDDIVTADSTKKTTITANGSASKSLQYSDLTAQNAADIFKNIQTDADARLQASADKVILSTRTLANRYLDFLESKANDASFVKNEAGQDVIKRRGTEIIIIDSWERTIKADFDNGTTYHKPHRALMTTKSNIQLALTGSFVDPEIWYSKDTEKNNFRSKYKVDAKIAEDYMSQVAY